MMSGVIAFVLGWLASFSASIIYELGIRPKIDIQTEDPRISNIDQRIGQKEKHRFIRLVIENKKASVPWRWVTERRSAWHCEVTYEFFSAVDPKKKVIQDRITARWASAPELLAPARGGGQINGQPTYRNVPDISKLPYGRRFDLHGDMQESIDLLIKIEGQQECYIFSNESYLLGWENENWRLDSGEYLVQVLARSGQIRKQRTFKIINTGTTLEDVSVERYTSTGKN